MSEPAIRRSAPLAELRRRFKTAPVVALLGAPQYYGRFGFRPAEELGVVSPEPEWGDGFQARPLTAYSESLAGHFQYASAFSS